MSDQMIRNLNLSMQEEAIRKNKDKRIAELELLLADSRQREEALRHENHNLNWALGSDGYEKMYTSEEQEAADTAHAETLERIATMKKRGDRLVELEQRVKVLTDAANCLLKTHAASIFMQGRQIGKGTYVEALKQLQDTVNATPQQTADQIERGHIEWMMKQNMYGFVPAFLRFRRDQCGCLYAEYELQLTDCDGEFEGQAPTLVAIQPLPKESKE